VQAVTDHLSSGGAVFSPCRTWRYRLDRVIDEVGPSIGFVLHNPSIAGNAGDDPTSRRGIGYGRVWGASRIIYINPWAAVATAPVDFWAMRDPVGPDNDLHIAAVAGEVARSGGFFVFAWGSVNPPRALRAAARQRLADVERLVRARCGDVRALGVTKAGQPRHPLYMPAGAELAAWGTA
jgi:hypothetical protein